MRPAGYWRRAAAWSLDAALLAPPALALCWNALAAAATPLLLAWAALVDAVAGRMAAAIVAAGPYAPPDPGALAGLVLGSMRDPALLAAAGELQRALLAAAGPPLIAFVALSFTLCASFEGSRLRATPGKRALGLRVAAVDGCEPGIGAVLLRFAAGALSWLSLNVGHALAALPPEHAALHDRISGTRVMLAAGASGRMPRWAVAWLALLGAALLLATAWATLAMGAAMQAALDRALWG